MTPRRFAPASKAARAAPHVARAARRRRRRSPARVCARANASVASRLAPAPVPSRRMSVKTIAAAPARSARRAISSAVAALSPSQPSTATRPSRWSMPTAIRPGKARAGARRAASGFARRRGAEDRALGAGVEHARDRVEVAQPAADLDRDRQRGADLARSPSRARARRAPRRRGRRRAGGARPRPPSAAPSRPGRRRTCVSAAKSPCRRRTQRPPRRSIAGMTSKRPHAGTATCDRRAGGADEVAEQREPGLPGSSRDGTGSRTGCRAPTAAVNSSPP